jgi:hypothetical protein
MLTDINKTPLTLACTKTAACWMAERGFKPVAEEVYVAKGWIADLASIVAPTRTDAIKLKLISKRPPHVNSADRETLRLALETEYAWSESYRALPPFITCCVEVKVSWSDYTKDLKRKFSKTPCHLQYVAMPIRLHSAIVRAGDYVGPWGIILLSDEGTRVVKVAKQPALCRVEESSISRLAYALAMKLDNDERYKHFRTRDKNIRMASRVNHVVDSLIHLACGRSVETMGPFYRSQSVEGQRALQSGARTLKSVIQSDLTHKARSTV